MSWNPSRRAWMRGAGSALLLPFLPSVLAPAARAAAGAPPRRLVVFFVPNGMPDTLWRPLSVGRGFVAAPITAALDPVRDRSVVLSGLRHADDPAGNGHFSSAGACLTGAHPGGAGIGASFDQRIADRYAPHTLRASLQVTSEHDTPCPESACTRREHISWRSWDQPATLDTSVLAVFGKVYGGGGHGPSRSRTSVLDAVRADLARYHREASVADAARLDAYAEGLRSVERRAILQPADTCPATVARPDEDGFHYGTDADIRTMLDLIVLGLQCDVTRVVTFMLGKAGSDRPLHGIGVPLGHHELSHAPPSARHTAFGTWVLGHFVHLVQALDAVADADGGSLLDHTDVLFLSDMGDGPSHGMENVPCVLAGAGARPWAGQHLVHDGRPMSDLYLSLMAAHGIDEATFGALGTSPLLSLGA